LEMGTVTVLKCHFIQFIMSGSFTLTVVPILYKLIIDYPKEIKLFEWISSNRYYFLLFFSMFDILFNLLTIISPFKVIDKIIPDGQNYQVCSFSVLGNIILWTLLLYKLLIIIGCLCIMIVEWKSNEIKYELNILFTIIFIFSFSLILLLIIYIFEINNYIYIFILKSTIIVIFSVSNYAFIFYLGINMEVCDKNWSKKTINVNKVKYNIDISINTSSVANREDFTNFYDTSTTTDY